MRAQIHATFLQFHHQMSAIHLTGNNYPEEIFKRKSMYVDVTFISPSLDHSSTPSCYDGV